MEENFSMEWNMEENFSMEWNMEWKIFGMEWKWNGRKLSVWNMEKSSSIPYHALIVVVSFFLQICIDLKNTKSMRSVSINTTSKNNTYVKTWSKHNTISFFVLAD